MKQYRFVHRCLESTYEDVSLAVRSARRVKRRTFLEHVDHEDRKEIELSLGYEAVLPMSKDFTVKYYRGEYRGVPAYWFVWSGIEHFFTLDGELGPSAARSK